MLFYKYLNNFVFLKQIYSFLKKIAVLKRKTYKKYYSLFNFNLSHVNYTKLVGVLYKDPVIKDSSRV